MAALIQPQDQEAERQVLGACLMEREAAEKAQEILTSADFYISAHGEIFEAITHLINKKVTPDLVSITDYMRNKGRLESMGGSVFIAGLTGAVASTALIEQHARIVEKKAVARKMLAALEKVKAKAFNGDYESPMELLTFAEAELSVIEIKTNRGGLEHVGQGILPVMMDIENRARKKAINGIPTGYKQLTAWLAGYQNSDLIIVAGRTSMGKTSFAIQEAKTVAVKHGAKVAFFSLEMTRRQLIEKLLVNEGAVSAQNVRVGMLGSGEWDRISKAAETLLKSGVYIDDTTKLTTIDIAHRCRKMRADVGLDMVFIDYLGFIRSTRRAEKRYMEVGEITKDLKELAKELNVPVVLLCQIGRGAEAGEDKRPQLRDLRESADLEQDADVVMFLYRDEYYKREKSDKKGITEVILAKQRNGPTGKFEIFFVKESTRFLELERSVDDEQMADIRVVQGAQGYSAENADNRSKKVSKQKPFWSQ